MHRLFTIEDLIHEICFYLSLLDLSILARVSSTWFQHAIPRLYKEVSIGEALRPMGKTARVGAGDSSPYYFIETPTEKQWERFLKYSPYVKTLYIDRDRDLALRETVFKSRSKGVEHLFPNIRSLHWTAVAYPELTSLANSLISPSVVQLHLNIPDYQPAFFEHVSLLLKTRLSELHFLRIDRECRDTNGSDPKSDDFVKLMEKILTFFAPNLRSVHIPLVCNTECIVECLSRIPSLCNLTIGDVRHDNDNTLRTNSRAIYSRQAKFTSLGTFSFDGSLQSLHKRFLKPFNLSSVVTFSWHFNIDPANVQMFISTIVITCPRLQSLTLGVPKVMHYNWKTQLVPWASIRPVIRCRELTRLSLNCLEVSLTLEELTEFLQSRKTWTHLDIFTPKPLRVQDLFIYSEYCPNLTHLGIYLNASLPILLSMMSLLSHDSPKFQVLTSIDFSRSNFELCSVHNIANFLYKICKKPLDLAGVNSFRYRQISKVIASCHIEEEARTGKSLPIEDKRRVEQIYKS